MKVVVLDEAERDLDDGYWFYENQAEGVGAYFLRQVLNDLADSSGQRKGSGREEDVM